MLISSGDWAVALLLALWLPACLPDAGRPPAPPPQPPLAAIDLAPPVQETLDAGEFLSARKLFEQRVLPAIQPTCGPCHSGNIGPAFLASANPDRYEPYPITVAWENFLVDNPEQSLLLTRGPHEGPALNLDQHGLVLEWLRKEKAERDQPPAHRPQVRPFLLKLAPQTNRVELRELDRRLDGAYFEFSASPISATRGVTLRAIRFVNVLPGAQPDDQRTIHLVRPLFVVWREGRPLPDLSDSLATLDRSFKLNETDGGGAGVQLAPLLALPQYRPGDAVSIVFNVVETVGQVVSPSTCRPDGLSYFAASVRPYLAKSNACTRAGCHNGTDQAASLNFAPVLQTPGANLDYLAGVCEQLKFYRNNGTILGNTDPANPLGNAHPFRWTAMECSAAGLGSNCFPSFAAVIEEWTRKDR